jgi:diaminobutyrate-2-oxoglutarate transaminase
MNFTDAELARIQAFPGYQGNYTFPRDTALRNQDSLESEVRSYPRRIPITICRASGAFVEDAQGQIYLDCLSGAGALPIGHNHPEARAEIARQLDAELPMQTLDITTPVKDMFVQALMRFLPVSLTREACIQFCGPSGSDAVEAALKLARLATGRSGVFSFHGAYHGMTSGSLALMGNLNVKARRSGFLSDVHFFPFPYSLRCKFGLGGEAGERGSIRYLESVLHDQESGILKPAAIIVEPIQGEGGVIPASAYWMRELRRIASEHGIVLILDEVQCGIARTGTNFAFQHADIEPDILVLSKAVGGGLPLSCIVFRKHLDAWHAGEHAGTFRGNQLAMAAGTKTLEIIERDELAHNATLMGTRFFDRLAELQRLQPCIGDIRGRGLMIGVEIVEPGQQDALEQPLAAPARAARIQQIALKHGLIFECGGRHGVVLRFLPPLNITPEQVNYAVWAFGQALSLSQEFTRV